MSRLAAAFERFAAARRKALIPYVTAGFPNPGATVGIMHAMVAAGADVIELGVPFSDPMADGPVVQRANEAALALGVALRDVLAMVGEFRERDPDTPVVLMGYANPIERIGAERFLDDAARSGVDGLVVVDYPPEESGDFSVAARARGIDLIFLLAPTSGEERLARVLAMASGYVYYVSRKGVTGAGHVDTEEVAAHVAAIKRASSIPVGVGFGIRDAATARAIARNADAVIIGTRIIQLLDDGDPAHAAQRAGRFIAGIRAALDETDEPAQAHGNAAAGR
ncbi:MAG: tryptophan synthase subunit alpha [Burkholderiaceae bacterium]|nr:tryptophan synthase subunit alpha [Burkholderiaceae bacterium]